ncbi:MAG: pyridoxamine 5'-phosphate oxidase family protein [Acidimicrobiia bacterium]|nr:pyridoxamine 5'-phosphate oxidase family protein [Acidimicrobiia bacterium]
MGDEFYTDAHRALQDRFGSRALADRLTQVTVDERIAGWQRKVIERAPFFWLATADADGWPDVSYKGGLPGFVRVDEDGGAVSFPSYDGNGMYRSLGNIAANPRVGLLFMELDRPKRIRVKGLATLVDAPDVVKNWAGAELVVRVEIERSFPNCSRYIHKADHLELSEFAPGGAHEPPVPEWKESEDFKPFLPPGGPPG